MPIFLEILEFLNNNVGYASVQNQLDQFNCLSTMPEFDRQTARQTPGDSIYLAVLVLWLGSRVVSILDSGAEGPGFKSQSRCCRLTVLGKLFTPIVPLFTKQQNW